MDCTLIITQATNKELIGRKIIADADPVYLDQSSIQQGLLNLTREEYRFFSWDNGIITFSDPSHNTFISLEEA